MGEESRNLARERMRAVVPHIMAAFVAAKTEREGATVRLSVSAYYAKGGGRNLASFSAAGFLSDLLELVGDEELEKLFGEGLRTQAAADDAAGQG